MRTLPKKEKDGESEPEANLGESGEDQVTSGEEPPIGGASYYYDDAYGYEDYDPGEEEEAGAEAATPQPAREGDSTT